jgi:hypothetical protein
MLRIAQIRLEEALHLATEYGTFLGQAEVYQELGMVYRKRGFRRKAFSAFQDCLGRYEKLRARYKASKVRRELALLRRP